MLPKSAQGARMGAIVKHPQAANIASAAILFGIAGFIVKKSSTLLLSSGATFIVSMLMQNKDYKIKLLLPVILGVGVWLAAKKKGASQTLHRN